ncbi:MAG: enoyl-CoA hydratase/isomerase family protein [Solirubrobacterales bacterium]
MGIVETEDRGPVRHVVINRPEKRNALNREAIEALGAAFADAADDTGVRCVVLRGAGDMFSSGMDLASLRELSEQPESLHPFRAGVLGAWNILEEMAKPTICEIHGACIGGAMELAVACDLRTIADSALMGIPEVRVGLIPDVGGCSRLPAIVGLGRAKELVMTGRMIDGTEAERIGLANRVGPAETLDDVTGALVDELLAGAPLAVGAAKAVLDRAAKPALAETLDDEVAAQEALAASADFAEGTGAFFEKRQPSFTGS